MWDIFLIGLANFLVSAVLMTAVLLISKEILDFIGW